MNIQLYAQQTEKLLKELLRANDYKRAFFLLLNILTNYDERFNTLKNCID